MAPESRFIKYAAGALTIPAGGFAELSSSLRLTLPAAVGDTLEVGFAGYGNPGTGSAYALDVATLVAGAIVNRFSNETDGVLAWYITASQSANPRGGSAFYTVQANDIADGQVTVSLVGNRIGGSNAGTISATAGDPLFVSYTNHGQRAQSVAPQFAAPIVKPSGNPIFTTGTDAWDRDKVYLTVKKFGAADYRMWYGCADAAVNLNVCYATSTDGLTWTKPNLGQVTYAGSTANNIFHQAGNYGGYVLHDPAGASNRKFLMMLEELNGAGASVSIIGSEDGITNWSLVKTLSTGGTPFREGKSLMKRSDGRFLAFYVLGHVNGRRGIGHYLSNTPDPTGAWTDMGLIPALNAHVQTAQFYRLEIAEHSIGTATVWLGFVLRYNSTTEKLWMDLYQSEDEGGSWVSVTNQWIPLGAAGSWEDEMITSASLVAIEAGVYRLYYSAAASNHAAFPSVSQIGYGTVTP